MTRKSYLQKGFTLVELLVVVAILGILAVIAIPNLIRFLGAGDVAAANVEADTVRTAVLAYIVENNGDVPAGNIGEGNLGVLDDYIDRDITGSYTITADGSIIGTGGWERLEWEVHEWVRK